MNFRKIVAGILLFGGIIIISAFSSFDIDPLQHIIIQFNRWMVVHPQENVYLQLDKSYYATGNDIWFKAYVTAGSNHQLSGISGVLNVELIDDRDSVKQRLKLPIVSGLTWGDFSLPDTLNEGNYRIRAYTNWMRNAGEEYFFDKTITISNVITNQVLTEASYNYGNQNGTQQVNAHIKYTNVDGTVYASIPVTYQVQTGNKNIANGKGQTDTDGNLNINFINPSGVNGAERIITDIKLADKSSVKKILLVKATSANVDVQFFPEGGNLVSGNETKMAFKAVAANGLGTEIKGVVTDNENKQVATFNSNQLAMGVFNFKPESGKIYKAAITYVDGSVNIVSLPTAVNTGYSLTVDDTGNDNIEVKIIPGAEVESSTSTTEVISLIAQSRGTIYFAGKSQAGSKSFNVVIPKSKFPTGIIQFTLFNSSGEPLNERLVFIKNHDELKLNLKADKQEYTPRQKVKIELNTKNKNDQPVVGSFSVAVTNESIVPADENESSIFSGLLLTADIRGYIEKPGYYFAHDDEKTNADLDALMLTQGYHRFEWKQVLEDDIKTVAYSPEKSLQISGHLKNLFGKPVVNGKVTLFTANQSIFMIDTLTDSEGRFTFKNLVFKDSIRFLIQGRSAKDHKNLQVELDNLLQQRVRENKNAPDWQANAVDEISPFLKNSKAAYESGIRNGTINRSIALKEVVIKDKKMQAVKNSSNLNGPGNADQVIAPDALQGCADIADCLQGRINGVIFRNDTPFLMRNLSRPMQIILDGVYVDGVVLSSLNPNDIGSVEVLRSIQYTSIYGGKGGNGLLIITTKNGNEGYAYQRYAPGVITFIPKGYSKVREFYSPKYDDPKTNSKIPDLRSTIYWKPNIITDKEGNASFEFFNADTKGNYRVVVEGIDSDGNLGRQVYRYKID
ncbi:carboxypeptidase regulatory-like domain-containing protein [Mucilaginibacter frigoritolerans]|nr:TonB-dependent receptor plug domain-containing protein [Mucilaginibacter frigoritolerans]